MATQKIYTIDKFLGLNEAADSYSELKMGEASKIVNFTITSGGNLSARHGFSKAPILADTQGILTVWTGFLRESEYLVAVDLADGADRLTVARVQETAFSVEAQRSGLLGLDAATDNTVKIFPFGDRIYVMSQAADLSIREDAGIVIETESPYIPLVVTGADPSGGGTQLENINLLTSKRRITYSADGSATTYVLPEEATAVLSAQTDSGELPFTFDASAHAVTFQTAPEKGVTNLTVTYDTDADTAAAARRQVTGMPHWEAYNGSTDTRLFFYGDGSNITLYTGVTETGKASALYVPAMNELAVDFSAAPITGMVRLYNKLMVYKPDGASFITYEPVTLTDGSVIAGFYLRTASKSVGSDSPGRVPLVNNCPRTLSAGSLYEWRTSSSFYNDERYAKRVSDRVVRSLRAASHSPVACDADSSHTYYLFLNDEKGTVLVNHYDLDVWTVYRSALATDVQQAMVCQGNLIFSTSTGIWFLDPASRYDSDGTQQLPIEAVWESGYMNFGANYRRKFSSYLWLTVKTESGSAVTVTAASDRKSVYAEKTLRSEVFDYSNLSYSNWSYLIASTLRARRVKLKVKKVIFYKLIIKVTEPGARGTILRCDQQVRFASLVK